MSAVSAGECGTYSLTLVFDGVSASGHLGQQRIAMADGRAGSRCAGGRSALQKEQKDQLTDSIQKKGQGMRERLFHTVRRTAPWILAALLILFFAGFLPAAPSAVLTGSMEPCIESGRSRYNRQDRA